jgi:hypothetical protein
MSGRRTGLELGHQDHRVLKHRFNPDGIFVSAIRLPEA